MEEDIKYLRNCIVYSIGNEETGMAESCKEYKQVIDRVLNRLEQLEKENKELSEELNSVKEIYYTQRDIDEDFILKSVIRDKIEETKQEDYFKKYYFDYQVNLYDFERGYKKCLKEILGGE